MVTLPGDMKLVPVIDYWSAVCYPTSIDNPLLPSIALETQILTTDRKLIGRDKAGERLGHCLIGGPWRSDAKSIPRTVLGMVLVFKSFFIDSVHSLSIACK